MSLWKTFRKPRQVALNAEDRCFEVVHSSSTRELLTTIERPHLSQLLLLVVSCKMALQDSASTNALLGANPLFLVSVSNPSMKSESNSLVVSDANMCRMQVWT